MMWTLRGGSPLSSPDAFARSRGFLSATHMQHPSMPDPSKILNIESCWKRIARAKKNGARVVVYGDSDCDGICGTAILTKVLRGLDMDVLPMLSNRLLDGYGLTLLGVENAKKEGANVIITVDCGIQDHEAVLGAKRTGMEVIVIDNHIAREGPPDNTLCVYADPAMLEPVNLSAAGLAYMVAEGVGHVDSEWITLAALANVADVMPLRGEARALVKHGLSLLQTTTQPGLMGLVSSADLLGQPIDTYQAAFRLIPRLNAVGRMGRPELGLWLLLAENHTDAAKHLRGVENCYKQRKELTKEAIPTAIKEAQALHDRGDNALCVWGPWHQGILGILASKVADRFKKPTAVFTSIRGYDNVIHGSARAPEGVDLYSIIKKCDSYLVKWGGHKEAVGLSARWSGDHGGWQINKLRTAFREAAFEMKPVPRYFDGEVPLRDVASTMDRLEALGPFGKDVDAPTFVSRVDVASHVVKLGEYGYKFAVSDPSCISFGGFLWGEHTSPDFGDEILIRYKPYASTSGRFELNILDYKSE